MRGDVGCPVCGSPDFSCGMATSTTGADERNEEASAMAELREYRVTVNGHDTIMNLSKADAARLGGTLAESGDVAQKPHTAPNKAHSPSLKNEKSIPRKS